MAPLSKIHRTPLITDNWENSNILNLENIKNVSQSTTLYLHRYIENLKKNAIPNVISFRNRYIFTHEQEPRLDAAIVMRQLMTHLIEECNKKLKTKLKNKFDQIVT